MMHCLLAAFFWIFATFDLPQCVAQGKFPGRPGVLIIPPQTETEESITLLWDKPATHVNITGYQVFCDGRRVAETSKAGCTVKHLLPDRSYSFYIAARDASDNVLSSSPIVAAHTRRNAVHINVVDYGAKGDGLTKNTVAIQRAIDACPANGVVYIPSGNFLSGALFLHSDMALQIEDGGVLRGTTDLEDYQPKILNRFEGWEMETFASLINAGTLDHTGPYSVRNIAITGRGKIIGGGRPLAQAMTAAGGSRSRGRLICIMNCRGLDIDGLTIEEPPSRTIHYIYCEGVSCHDLVIHSTVNNGDGIDPDSSTNSYIFNCSFSTSDDCIAIKSGKNPEGQVIGRPTENVRITDCAFVSGHGISIGSEISGGVRNVLVSDCETGDLVNGLQVKTIRARGGVVEGLTVRDCKLGKIRITTDVPYNNDGAAAKEAPFFRNFEFSNLDMAQANISKPVISLDGFDDLRHRTRDLLFEHITLPDGALIKVNRCEGLRFVDVLTRKGVKPDFQITNSRAVDY